MQHSATSLGDMLLATKNKHNAAQKRAKGREGDGQLQYFIKTEYADLTSQSMTSFLPSSPPSKSVSCSRGKPRCTSTR